jgi:hypothetical protein
MFHFKEWTKGSISWPEKKIQMSHRMLIPFSRAVPLPLQWDYSVYTTESSTYHFLYTTIPSKFKNCTILRAALWSKCLQCIHKDCHMDLETCDAKVDWIYLTITIRWDVKPCSLVGRLQLSLEPATYILMAETWICHIQDAVNWTKQLTSLFHKKWKISWLAAQLPVSQDGRSSMKSVSCFCNLHAWRHNVHPVNTKSENAGIVRTLYI